MNVTIINTTANARELLIFSKKTRLKMSGDSFFDIMNMTEEEKQKELDYVFGTIGSSWEFVDYSILIEGVTRAFTHQLVRHRVGVSFAQQAQRVVDMSDFEYLDTTGSQLYKDTMDVIRKNYSEMIEQGIHPQDARGVLPTNNLTTILMKINLRALSGLMNTRLCYKAQGEFQNVAREIRKKVLEIHPWAAPILQVHCVQHLSCAFPGYRDCPIKKSEWNILPPEEDEKFLKSKALKIWENTQSEYQPKGE